MTWLTAWPGAIPVEHPNQAAAEAHAAEIVRSKKAEHATAYEMTLPGEMEEA